MIFWSFLTKAVGWEQCSRVLYNGVKWTNYLVTIIYSRSVLFLVLRVNATVSSAARCSWMPWSTKWSNTNMQEIFLKSPSCVPDRWQSISREASLLPGSLTSQSVLWSSSLYQPFSFLPTLSIDGMIMQSWHVWELRPFPSDLFWILNASSSWSNMREEDSLQSWHFSTAGHNLCTATTPSQSVYGSIRSWRS